MRLPELRPADLNPSQRQVLDDINNGPRSAQMRELGIAGPFAVWIRAPALGGPTQALGAAVRYASSLPENVKEVAICTVGQFHQARFEFAAHHAIALDAGVDANALDKLRRGLDPQFEGAEALAHEIARALLGNHRIPDDLYAHAHEQFGEQALIELVLTVGYYCLVSHTLNAFEVPLTANMPDPFPDAPR